MDNKNFINWDRLLSPNDQTKETEKINTKLGKLTRLANLNKSFKYKNYSLFRRKKYHSKNKKRNKNLSNTLDTIAKYSTEINQPIRSNLILLIIWSILFNLILYFILKILKESQITIKIFFKWKFMTSLILNFLKLLNGTKTNIFGKSFIYKIINIFLF